MLPPYDPGILLSVPLESVRGSNLKPEKNCTSSVQAEHFLILNTVSYATNHDI